MKPPFDESDLERRGAAAAAAGHPWHSNPFLRPENMPAATGETLREWSRKHDAWQRGFEGAVAMAMVDKDTLPAEVLSALVQRRLAWIPAVREELARNRFSELRVEAPRAHERDTQGRNWNIESFECGSLDPGSCAVEFRAAVDRVRDDYDLG